MGSAPDPQGSSLTPEQQQALDDAQQRAKAFLGASRMAALNGWTLAFFAGVSLLVGLFSFTSFVMGIALGVIARNELVGRQRLRAFDPDGLDLLWRNQIGLMAVIVAYCAWSMYRSVAAPDPELAALTQFLGSGTGELITQLTIVLYASVLVASIVYQGWNARYYFVRKGRLEAHVHDTPAWVLEVQRDVRG